MSLIVEVLSGHQIMIDSRLEGMEQYNWETCELFALTMPSFYQEGSPGQYTAPSNVWMHYGYNNGKNCWWDWGFSTEDWTIEDRMSSFHDKDGSMNAGYKWDSWIDNSGGNTVRFDRSGMQRSPDADFPYYYTLNSAGSIDSRLEGMEQYNWETGGLYASAPDSIAGKMLWSNDGQSPAWSSSALWVHLPDPPSIHEWWLPPIGPSGDGKDSPLDWYKKIKDEFQMGAAAGDSPGPGQTVSAGWDNPNYGLGDAGVGTFTGLWVDRTWCTVPSPLQPAIPPGGLFGPDMPVRPRWRFPHYTPPPDVTPSRNLPGARGRNPWIMYARMTRRFRFNLINIIPFISGNVFT